MNSKTCPGGMPECAAGLSMRSQEQEFREIDG